MSDLSAHRTYVVVGSASFSGNKYKNAIKRDLRGKILGIDSVITGTVRGPEEWAVAVAREKHARVTVVPLGVDKLVSSGSTLLSSKERQELALETVINRYETMMKGATHMIAYWDGKSRGTEYAIALAKRLGIEVIEAQSSVL